MVQGIGVHILVVVAMITVKMLQLVSLVTYFWLVELHPHRI
jgi:hypothetical protein